MRPADIRDGGEEEEDVRMGPSIVAVQRAADLFSDPKVRARVLAWHEQDVPLLEMVERLGFLNLMEPVLRDAIERLTPEEVAIIRSVFVAEIERAGEATDVTMPVRCGIIAVTGSVDVSSDGRGPGSRGRGGRAAVLSASLLRPRI